jgi:hypothetical protein
MGSIHGYVNTKAASFKHSCPEFKLLVVHSNQVVAGHVFTHCLTESQVIQMCGATFDSSQQA